ncbi:MAG: cobalt ECF transporter T component CbiQ [Desulfobacteraceae bacterium]|nr:cobalt ECF transporter T component CbiQ [Desulfobacteraceae bacterium]MBC2756662.1 cobalt ECF transporter T component CbiQ [Desulfobacteraceae bacterium]
MIEEPFAAGNSIIHRIDPRFRVAAATFYSFTVALCYEFQPLIAALAVSMVSVLLSGVGLKKVFKRLALVNVFILLFWIVLPLTYAGNTVYSLGPVHVYPAGIVFAAKITIKSNAILMVLISFIATMTFATLGHSLSRLRIPEKLVFLLMITYRYIFVIQQEYQKIIRSIKIRGFKPKTTLHSYKTFAYVIGMLLIRASERADRVYNAMRCRGFKGKYYSLTDFQADTKSWVFVTIVSGVTLGILLMEVLFNE